MSEAVAEIAPSSTDKEPKKSRIVKTNIQPNIPNCAKLEPFGVYYGRCRINGRLVRESPRTFWIWLRHSNFVVPDQTRRLSRQRLPQQTIGPTRRQLEQTIMKSGG